MRRWLSFGARTQRITLFTSAPVIAELQDVLGRDKFTARIARVGRPASDLLDGYRALTTLVRAAALAPTARNLDDDAVLACALTAQAQLIVTRARDLLELGAFQNIPIRPTRSALELIAASQR